jgi:hypothetical protein
MSAAAPAEKHRNTTRRSCFTQRDDATVRWRSGATFQPLARWPGFTEGRTNRSSPEWPRAEEQASVKMGGAVRRREGRRRWRGDVEVVEAGALDNGGSGSSHGQLQPSRRTAFPQRPPTPPSPSPFFSASSVRVCGQGNGSPEAARVGRALGFAAAATYSGGQCGGVRGRQGCSSSPWGAPRRRPCMALPRFGASISKRGKKEDDDGDVIVTHCGPHRSAACCGARLVAVLVGRDWAGRRRQAERLVAARV